MSLQHEIDKLYGKLKTAEDDACMARDAVQQMFDKYVLPYLINKMNEEPFRVRAEMRRGERRRDDGSDYIIEAPAVLIYIVERHAAVVDLGSYFRELDAYGALPDFDTKWVSMGSFDTKMQAEKAIEALKEERAL